MGQGAKKHYNQEDGCLLYNDRAVITVLIIIEQFCLIEYASNVQGVIQAL